MLSMGEVRMERDFATASAKDNARQILYYDSFLIFIEAGINSGNYIAVLDDTAEIAVTSRIIVFYKWLWPANIY